VYHKHNFANDPGDVVCAPCSELPLHQDPIVAVKIDPIMAVMEQFDNSAGNLFIAAA
jgi:hypothetical protein